ncbi:MAG: hypothetical protein ACP5NQ_04975 [Vulcanisaeta sp.]
MNRALIIAVPLIIIVVAVITVLLIIHSANTMSYVNRLRELISNGTFTAVYSVNGTSITMSESGNRVSNYSVIEQMSLGYVNGSRVFIIVTRYINETSIPEEPRMVLSENAYWINGTSLCEANYVIINGHSSGGSECFSPGTYSLFMSLLPFNILLGNASASVVSEGFSANFSIITYVNYVNSTKWHGKTVYCYKIISKEIRESEQVMIRISTNSNIIGIICLLPNGLPAISMLNVTSMTAFNDARAIIIESLRSELVNYVLNYFNTTAFNELMTAARNIR